MSALVLSLTESQTLTALRAFILSVIPAGIEVIRGLDNRVPEPAGTDFVVMTPIMRERLETTVDGYAGLDYQILTFGSIANVPVVGNTLTNGAATAHGIVSAVSGLTVTVNSITGQYFAIGDVITNQTLSQTIGTVIGIGYGGKTALMPSKVTVQLDVHGPNSADYAHIISTLFRDQYATDQFATSGFDVFPLYADDPKQLPFLNGEQQIEERWSIDAVMQTNPIVTVPMQYMDAVTATLINVDATYPPV